MAQVKREGSGRLEEALALLLQARAAFLARAAEIDARRAEMARIDADRFARLEDRFARILALLLENKRLAQALPDAICEKIGFKASPP